MGSRYGGPAGYDEDAVWSRGDGGYNMRKSPPPLIYSAHPSAHNHNPHHTSHTIVHSSIKPMPDSDIYKVGIYVINLALTVWIMTVLDFSMDGIGALKVEQDGIKVLGRSEFDNQSNSLAYPPRCGTRRCPSTLLRSNHQCHNFSGYSTASLNLNPDGKASAVCERFEVLDPVIRL
uniref:Uncharacterized protein n=1 Tax=Ditylenchus dipsaci TaxID=166011 RepID=A0A915E4S5_9BILA